MIYANFIYIQEMAFKKIQLVCTCLLGFSFSVFVSVRLEKQIDDNLAKFERRISTMPEVVDCWLMTGSYDYLLRVVTQNIEDYEEFLLGELTRTEGVASIESSIPLRRVKSQTARTIVI